MGKTKYEEGLDGYDWYEGQPKWPLRRILKVVMYSLSALVWILILLRIFTSGNSLYEDKLILLNDRAAEIYPEKEQTVVRINSSTESEKEGDVFVYYPVYLPAAENLQCSIRVNRRELPPGEGEAGYRFILRESREGESEYHELSYFSSKKQFRYSFYRLAFENVTMEEGSVYTLMIFPEDHQAASSEEPFAATDALYHFTLCNSDTYCNETRPKESQFKTLEEM